VSDVDMEGTLRAALDVAQEAHLAAEDDVTVIQCSQCDAGEPCQLVRETAAIARPMNGDGAEDAPSPMRDEPAPSPDDPHGACSRALVGVALERDRARGKLAVAVDAHLAAEAEITRLQESADLCDGCGSPLSRCLRWHHRPSGYGKCCPDCKHPAETRAWTDLLAERDRLRAFADAVLGACDESDRATFDATAYDGVDRVSVLPTHYLARLAAEHGIETTP
jgi:hypothetical protein